MFLIKLFWRLTQVEVVVLEMVEVVVLNPNQSSLYLGHDML